MNQKAFVKLGLLGKLPKPLLFTAKFFAEIIALILFAVILYSGLAVYMTGDWAACANNRYSYVDYLQCNPLYGLLAAFYPANNKLLNFCHTGKKAVTLNYGSSTICTFPYPAIFQRSGCFSSGHFITALLLVDSFMETIVTLVSCFAINSGMGLPLESYPY